MIFNKKKNEATELKKFSFYYIFWFDAMIFEEHQKKKRGLETRNSFKFGFPIKISQLSLKLSTKKKIIIYKYIWLIFLTPVLCRFRRRLLLYCCNQILQQQQKHTRNHLISLFIFRISIFDLLYIYHKTTEKHTKFISMRWVY